MFQKKIVTLHAFYGFLIIDTFSSIIIYPDVTLMLPRGYPEDRKH